MSDTWPSCLTARPAHAEAAAVFEAYASGTAFARRARLLAAGDAQTTLGKNGKPIDSRGVFLAGREGDALANRLIDDEAELLGRGITNLIHILSPELVVIGGGLANEFDRLHPASATASLAPRCQPFAMCRWFMQVWARIRGSSVPRPLSSCK